MAKATILLCTSKQLYTGSSLSSYFPTFFQCDTACDKMCFKKQMVKQDVQSAYYYSFCPKLWISASSLQQSGIIWAYRFVF